MMITPLFVGRPFSLNAVEESLKEHKLILLLTQKDREVEEPKPDDLYSMGTVAVILKAMKMSVGRIKILVQGLGRARVKGIETVAEFFRHRITEGGVSN